MVTDPLRTQLIELRRSGLTYAQLAAVSGMSVSGVQYAIRDHVEVHPHGQRVRRAVALRADGYTYAAIATRCGYRDAAAARAAVYRHRAGERARALDAAVRELL